MVTKDEIKQRLSATGEVEWMQVKDDGYHYQVTVVSNIFLGKSKLARQQWVYAKLKDYIMTGSLHALSIKTWTKEEWEKKQHG